MKSFNLDGIIGLPALESVSVSPEAVVGTQAKFQRTDGKVCEAIYAQTGGTGILHGMICYEASGLMVQLLTDTNTGRPVYFAAADIPLHNYGWFVYSGTADALCSVSIGTSSNIYSSGAGKISGVELTGRQVLGAISMEAFTNAPGIVRLAISSPHMSGGASA